MRLVRIALWALFTVCWLALPEDAVAQRLYSQERDEQAQATLKIVADLQSGTLFDKQLKNLSLLAKRDMEASLAAAKTRMRSDINSFTTWRDVNCVVRRTDQKIKQVREDDTAKNAEARRRLTELTDEISRTKTAFNAMKREAECRLTAGSESIDTEKCPDQKPGRLASFFEHAGNLEDIEASVRLLSGSAAKNKDITEATDIAKSALAALKKLYENYQKRMNEYNNLQGELLDIQVQLKKVALLALQVEEQHLKSLIKIRARREVEEANIISMIDDYEAFSVKYDLGFSRQAPAPCTPEEAEDNERPSGNRAIRKVSDKNIEMLLRDLVAKVKHIEAALDKTKSDLAEQEAPVLFHMRAVNRLGAAERAATTEDDRRAARDALQRARDTLAAEEAKNPAIARGRKDVDVLTDALSDLREELATKLFILHLAAGISARGEIPRKLAALRAAHEDHAYSIRKSGVMARAYQLTVSGGVKRLALYHKGGIKPSVVARLVHAAANVAIPPILAAK